MAASAADAHLDRQHAARLLELEARLLARIDVVLTGLEVRDHQPRGAHRRARHGGYERDPLLPILMEGELAGTVDADDVRLGSGEVEHLCHVDPVEAEQVTVRERLALAGHPVVGGVDDGAQRSTAREAECHRHAAPREAGDGGHCRQHVELLAVGKAVEAGGEERRALGARVEPRA